MSQPFDPAHESLNRAPLDDLRLLSGDYWGELRVFLAVAKAKSYNRAAEALHSSQPTVSRQIKRLQDVLGSQLLLSSHNGIELTKRGRELADSLVMFDEKMFALSRGLRGETRETEGMVRVTSTEALAGLFMVPALASFSELYPKIRVHFRNPINLMGFRENLSDIVLSYAPASQLDIESRHVGFVHLIPVATRPYFSHFGIPTRTNLEDHFFIDADYYSSQNETWARWRKAIDRGSVAHLCDNSFAYGFMVKMGLGIGLLGNFTLADSDAVPLDIDLHVRLPLFLLASTERLQMKSVRIVYDWISEIFSTRAWFDSDLKLDASSQGALPLTLSRLYAGTPFAVQALQQVSAL